MGVGLAVVREAVKRLEALNIIGATHGSGTVVRPFRWLPLIYDTSLFQLAAKRIGIRDLWETRQLLEGQIVRLASQRATASNLKTILSVLKRADPIPLDYDVSQGLNREFHLAVAEASQNPVLSGPAQTAGRRACTRHRASFHRRHEPADLGRASSHLRRSCGT